LKTERIGNRRRPLQFWIGFAEKTQTGIKGKNKKLWKARKRGGETAREKVREGGLKRPGRVPRA